jgi:hypothetical protein
MTIPSRVLGAGASALSTVAICGDGVDDLTATGSTQANALQLVHVHNSVDTTPSGSGVRLPPTEVGAVIYIANSGAHDLLVYAYEVGSTINQNASATVKKDHAGIFFAVELTKWYGISGAKA